MVRNSTKIKKNPVLLFVLVTAALFLSLTLLAKFNVIPPVVMPTPQSENSAIPTDTSVSSGKKPAAILNLANWKLTLPSGPAKDATEIKQPQLATFQDAPWYHSLSDGTAVVFRAPVNGATTENSEYPRSELREMINNGRTEADWNTASGIHTLTVEEAVTAVPLKKRQIVTAQIHDAGDDVIVIRLDYPKLYINVDGKNEKVLDPAYVLGRKFSIKFVVEGNKTQVYYNGSSEPVYTLAKAYSGAYFKAGAYTQSNCTKEALTGCNTDNYGEVVIYHVEATHR